MLHPFKVLEPEYQRRLAILKITRKSEVTKRAEQILRHKEVIPNFKPVQDVLGIPMVWMICSFERESGLDFTRSPAQGDRWDRVSVNVPRGVGPFKSFTDAALWSYRHDGLDKNSAPWTWAYGCWGWEKFNGFGPRDHGRVSGYVFSGTDQYDPPAGLGGKYVSDGRWSGSTVDSQLGCVPLALELIRLEPTLALLPDASPVLGPVIVTSVPVGVGGGTHDTKWIQLALNIVGVSGTPLTVDGSCGRMTRNAVRAFQSIHGLEIDGLAGPLTTAALEQASGMR
jgi:lysozyme family protein